MRFKRKGPKSTRSGCLFCKPWKAMGNSKSALKKQALQIMEMSDEELNEYLKESLEKDFDKIDEHTYRSKLNPNLKLTIG